MSENSAIPEAAVEAALISAYGNPRKGNKALWKAMRATLEAAAPHMLSEAWEEGKEAGLNGGWDNPYEVRHD